MQTNRNIGKKAVAGIAAQLANQKALGLILIIGIVVYFSYGTGSILNIPEQTKNEIWQGNEIVLNSPFFGQLTGGENSSAYGIQDRSLKICGDNNGKVSLSNSYSTSSRFLLSSSISSNDAPCSESNYINSKITFKNSGNLTFKCSLSATPRVYQDAKASCKVGSYSKTIDPSLGRKGLDAYSDPMTFEESSTIQVKEGDVLIVSVLDSIEQGSASSSLELNFVANQVVSTETISTQQETTSISVKEATTTANNFIQRFFDWLGGLFK